MFPALQQYGLIYRVRMNSLGFDAKETTIIVNVVMTLSSLVGMFIRISNKLSVVPLSSKLKKKNRNRAIYHEFR